MLPDTQSSALSITVDTLAGLPLPLRLVCTCLTTEASFLILFPLAVSLGTADRGTPSDVICSAPADSTSSLKASSLGVGVSKGTLIGSLVPLACTDFPGGAHSTPAFKGM
ncbi:hypothetical protein V8G54_035631 [Vigna mungo]|uniref:Uncharacterized protein n=1 Tax=Vigna mungo TaxID=3915 RepID=A0AAQ3RES4_VIGMU